MPEIADIFRDHHVGYPHYLTAEQRHAIRDIICCRTPKMGCGAVYRCPDCGNTHFAWLSCGNRNCPKCGNDKVTKYLQKQQQNILPVNYFMVTLTLPHEIHPLCRKYPELAFNAFFRCSQQSIKELALNPRHLGGHIGIIATLQTWRRDGDYHPHIHCLVPGGGISRDKKYWLYPKKREFLIPAKPLSILLRGKMRAELQRLKLFTEVPPETWAKHWVTDCRNVGNGMSSFKYLAPYMQRGFMGNNRLIQYDGENVTFRYTESTTETQKYRTIPALEFMALYLQHVLPSGFQKTRYYGFLGSANKKTIRELCSLILRSRYSPPVELEDFHEVKLLCPSCGKELRFSRLSSRAPP